TPKTTPLLMSILASTRGLTRKALPPWPGRQPFPHALRQPPSSTGDVIVPAGRGAGPLDQGRRVGVSRFRPLLDTAVDVCAPSTAWERGKGCNEYTSETFRRNPAGRSPSSSV